MSFNLTPFVLPSIFSTHSLPLPLFISISVYSSIYLFYRLLLSPSQVWSPYQQPNSLGDLEGRVEDKSRSLYTHEEYISLVLNSGSGLSHDYVSQSIQEDPRMMAFFDSLVRREIEGWSSDSDSDLSEGAILQLHARGRRSTRTTPAAPPAAASAAGHHSDSDHSSSSSLAGPGATGGEEPAGAEEEGRPRQRRGRRQRHQSSFLLDLVNEDSDSSGFWPDPMPRPRSPSPPGNSTLSSPTSSPSSPAGASSSSTSSSTSSSSSDAEDEERRRATTRQRNAARRRLMHFPSRSGERSESVRALFSAIDSCSYPKISIDDPSSSSSGEAQDAVQIRPCSSADRDEEKRLSPSEFVCLSPVMSPESQENEGSDRAELEGPSTAFLLSTDTLRTESRARERDSAEAAVEGSDSGEECSSSLALDSNWASSSHLSPGVNGRHRTGVADRGHVGQNPAGSSESEGETGVTPADTRPQAEGTASQRGQAQGALKRTRVGSGEGGSGSSPSEKKFKT